MANLLPSKNLSEGRRVGCYPSAQMALNPKNEKIAIEMLDEIDRARSGSLSLEDLEFRLWRLLEATDTEFPRIVAGQVEDLVLEIRQLQKNNSSFAETDPDRGVDEIYNAITSAIGSAL